MEENDDRAPGPWTSGRHAPTEETAPRRPRRPGVAILLGAIVILPLLAMSVIGVAWAKAQYSELTSSSGVADHVAVLEGLITARAALTGEQIASGGIATGHDLGLTPAQINAIVGIDFLAQLRVARAAVSGSAALEQFPTLRRQGPALSKIRAEVDADTAGLEAVNTVFGAVNTETDRLWTRQLTEMARDASAAPAIAGSFQQRLDALEELTVGFRAALDVIDYTNRVVMSPGRPDDLTTLIRAQERFTQATSEIKGDLGPFAARAWNSTTTDAASTRFGAVVGTAITDALEQRPNPLSTDLRSYGAALTDGAKWLGLVTTALTAAASDLRSLAATRQAAAADGFWTAVALLALVVVVTSGLGFTVWRFGRRAVHALLATTRAQERGDYDVSVPPRGPRELVELAAAANSLNVTLKGIERYVTTVAEDPGSPLLETPVAGPVGRALQQTLDRLRSSIAAGVEQRRQLEELATHDMLTGALNRAGAMDALERELARSARVKASLMILFIDIDDLKGINDLYGHEIGDRAISVAAGAFRRAARRSDVVARFGGDEFVVGGVVEDPAQARTIAERLRITLASAALTAGGAKVAVHCSVGVAVGGPGEDLDSILHRADEALYVAKRRGRDQVA